MGFSMRPMGTDRAMTMSQTIEAREILLQCVRCCMGLTFPICTYHGPEIKH